MSLNVTLPLQSESYTLKITRKKKDAKLKFKIRKQSNTSRKMALQNYSKNELLQHYIELSAAMWHED